MGVDYLHDRYVNFYTDFAFKKLFGTEVNKELLISFLNAMFDGKEVISDLTYLNSEQMGTSETDRRAVFDVYCENEKGERFLIEMQKGEQQFFKDRSVFYSTFPIREQAKRGEWNYNLKAVYTIGILNFNFDDTDQEYFHHEVKLVDMKTKEVFYDKLTFIYLEMPKFTKREDELVTLFDKWLYAIRHLATLFERPAVLQEKVFQHLFEAAEIAKFDRKELFEYEDSLKVYRDWFSVMQTAELKGEARGREEGLAEGMEKGIEKGMEKGMEKGIEKGRAEGMAEGIEQGIKQGLMKTAANMKAKGIDTATIADLTGLQMSDIERL